MSAVAGSPARRAATGSWVLFLVNILTYAVGRTWDMLLMVEPRTQLLALAMAGIGLGVSALVRGPRGRDVVVPASVGLGLNGAVIGVAIFW